MIDGIDVIRHLSTQQIPPTWSGAYEACQHIAADMGDAPLGPCRHFLAADDAALMLLTARLEMPGITPEQAVETVLSEDIKARGRPLVLST